MNESIVLTKHPGYSHKHNVAPHLKHEEHKPSHNAVSRKHPHKVVHFDIHTHNKQDHINKERLHITYVPDMKRDQNHNSDRDNAGSKASPGEFLDSISNASSREQKMFYIEQEALLHGYDTKQAAGMIGNFLKETGTDLDTNPVQDRQIKALGHHYKGLAQWAGSRKHELKAFAAANGKSENDFAIQVAFAFKELAEYSRYGAQQLKQAKTPEAAAVIFCKLFERPAARYAVLSKRQEFAREAYIILTSNSDI